MESMSQSMSQSMELIPSTFSAAMSNKENDDGNATTSFVDEDISTDADLDITSLSPIFRPSSPNHQQHCDDACVREEIWPATTSSCHDDTIIDYDCDRKWKSDQKIATSHSDDNDDVLGEVLDGPFGKIQENGNKLPISMIPPNSSRNNNLEHDLSNERKHMAQNQREYKQHYERKIDDILRKNQSFFIDRINSIHIEKKNGKDEIWNTEMNQIDLLLSKFGLRDSIENRGDENSNSRRINNLIDKDDNINDTTLSIGNNFSNDNDYNDSNNKENDDVYCSQSHYSRNNTTTMNKHSLTDQRQQTPNQNITEKTFGEERPVTETNNVIINNANIPNCDNHPARGTTRSHSQSNNYHYSSHVEDLSSSVSSVELVRNDNTQHHQKQTHEAQSCDQNELAFKSPTGFALNRDEKKKKRNASSSGKKGMDLRRMRKLDYNNKTEEEDEIKFNRSFDNISIRCDNESFDNSENIDSPSEPSQSFLDTSIHCSQSPISHRRSISTPSSKSLLLPSCINTTGETDIERPQRKRIVMTKRVIRFEETEDQVGRNNNNNNNNNNRELEESSPFNDTIETAECTILPKRQRNLKDKGNNSSSSVDIGNSTAPLDVSMKDGANFYLDPLRVNRPRPPPRWVKSYHARSKTKFKEREIEKRKKGHDKEDEQQLEHNTPFAACNNNTKNPILSYRDPFEEFGSRTADRLEVITNWLNRRDKVVNGDCSNNIGEDGKDDNDDDRTDRKTGHAQETNNLSEEENFHDKSNSSSRGKAIILSVSLPQIISLALNMFFENGIRDHRFNKSMLPRGSKSKYDVASKVPLNGGTLIVVRTKEDLITWQCAFRERSSFSVLNHFQIPSTERRRMTTASKCSGFDVVLTTYDAIKMKEVATRIDVRGRAIPNPDSQDGWFMSRKKESNNSLAGESSCLEERGESNSQSCKVLSVLHKMKWFRIIFVDDLGRKSFLTKPGTARTQAAISLKGKARYAM